MCLCLFAYKNHPQFDLILIHNRDEYYNRKSLPAQFWDDNRHLLAGKDLGSSGTWLGITQTGQWAMVTNFRKKKILKSEQISRGMLVKNFLTSSLAPKDYLQNILSVKNNYADFNLVVGNPAGLYHLSSQQGQLLSLKPGVYGLSNAFLDTPWPKVSEGKKKFLEIIQKKEGFEEDLFLLMKNTTPYPDQTLPNTGMGIEVERLLSSLFVRAPGYGTHSTTLLTISKKGEVHFIEKSYLRQKGQPKIVAFNFKIEKD